MFDTSKYDLVKYETCCDCAATEDCNNSFGDCPAGMELFGDNAFMFKLKENTMPTNEQIREAADRHTDAECALRELHPDAFEETFNSNQDNMSIADNHEGSYKIGTTWGVSKIKDGMLYLHLSVGHDGIKTDSQGRILIHPDSK